MTCMMIEEQRKRKKNKCLVDFWKILENIDDACIRVELHKLEKDVKLSVIKRNCISMGR